jgi:ribonuclease P protein component
MQTARLGLVVGKRALRRAVDRNRARRVLRETFRTLREELPEMDIVVQVIGPASNAEISAALSKLLAELQNDSR